MDVPVELRQLRYFVAVAEELHFGRAAERLHMSQSPLSRAIRELERELGLTLFVRTTRRVELTDAGCALLKRARRALVEVEAAVDDARRAARPDGGVISIGYTPLSRRQASRIAEELTGRHPELQPQLVEDMTPELLRRVAAHELTAAAVMETPAAARRYGVRIDALRDEPLLAAIPTTHRYAKAEAMPLGAFAAERILLPREPFGAAYNAWLAAVVRAEGLELERTLKTLSAPWDRRMLPIAEGEAVTAVVREWAQQPTPGVTMVPLDPPLNFPLDLASSATGGGELLVQTASRVRDDEGWLTRRPARTELPPN